MKQVFDVVVQRDESGWYVGTVPALRGCVSQGRTLTELRSNMAEAIGLYLDGEPRTSELVRFVKIERVEVSA